MGEVTLTKYEAQTAATELVWCARDHLQADPARPQSAVRTLNIASKMVPLMSQGSRNTYTRAINSLTEQALDELAETS